jgi:hypothetical protein
MNVHERPVGATVEWYTPPEVFERLRLEFDLDPASPGADKVPWIPARRHYTRADDGLAQPWSGMVWLNPPYGPSMAPFVDRLIEHDDGILLIAARTETAIFQRAAYSANVVAFAKDRIHFIRNDGFQARSSFGSVLMAFGYRASYGLNDRRFGWST